MFNNPAIVLNAIAEVIKAVIPALILFGILKWTPEQVAAVKVVVGVAVTALITTLTRAAVTPNAQVDKLIVTATRQAPNTSPEKVKSIQAAEENGK